MELTPHQQQAFEKIKAFVRDPEQQVFVLRGYAGTGKTTLARFLIEWLRSKEAEPLEFHPVLLASTGRAARILTNKAACAANTLHGHIYQLDVVDGPEVESSPQADELTGQLSINFGLKPTPPSSLKMVYIVDEASMLSHIPSAGDAVARFGSGSVLTDFFKYVSPNSKVIFIGDPAQLPPIAARETFSPALDENFLSEHYKLRATGTELTEVLRQKEGGEILELATRIRQRIANKDFSNWEELMKVRGKSLFTPYTQQIMIERYLKQVKENGWSSGLILTHSNKQAFYLNINIRKQLNEGKHLPFPKPGEILLVVQNSYYVPLANGDQVLLIESDKGGKRHGIKFSKVKVMALHNGEVYETLLLQDFLFAPEANLPPQVQKQLLIDFDQRMKKKGLKRNSEAYKEAMRIDPYLNALRAKFGYAVTCHKAQGGEWPHCFLNLSETLNMLSDEARFRWLYTAVSRAREFLDVKPVFKQKKRKV